MNAVQSSQDNQHKCQHIWVAVPSHWTSDEIECTLEHWIKTGPGLRHLIAPCRAFCEDNGENLPLSVVPIQYRNDWGSWFLIAVGLFEYPWDYSYTKIWQLPAKIRFIETDDSGHDHFHRLQKPIQVASPNREDSIGGLSKSLICPPIWENPSFRMKYPTEWSASGCKIYDYQTVILVNDVSLLSLTAQGTISFPHLAGQLLAKIDFRVGELYSQDSKFDGFNNLLPDDGFGRLVERETTTVNERAVQYAIVDSESYKISLIFLTVNLKTPQLSEAMRFACRLEFCVLTPLGEAQSQLQTFIDMVKTIEVMT